MARIKAKKIPSHLPGHCDLTDNVSLNKHEILKKLQRIEVIDLKIKI